MRISDWSSDVCSSDLRFDQRRLRVAEVEHATQMRQQRVVDDGDEPPHEKKARQQRQRRRVALRRADRRAPAVYGDTGWNGHERLLPFLCRQRSGSFTTCLPVYYLE